MSHHDSDVFSLTVHIRRQCSDVGMMFAVGSFVSWKIFEEEDFGSSGVAVDLDRRHKDPSLGSESRVLSPDILWLLREMRSLQKRRFVAAALEAAPARARLLPEAQRPLALPCPYRHGRCVSRPYTLKLARDSLKRRVSHSLMQWRRQTRRRTIIPSSRRPYLPELLFDSPSKNPTRCCGI